MRTYIATWLLFHKLIGLYSSRIKADIALASTSANRTRGVFNVKTTTSNAQLDVKFNDAPVLSHLFFRGRTTNGQAIATLHETYEGAFSESTSRLSKGARGMRVTRSETPPALATEIAAHGSAAVSPSDRVSI